MQRFNNYLEETEKASQKHVVLALGRFQPPTAGHEKLIKKVHDLADEYQAHHHVIATQTFDGKKNPLDPETKLKHLKAFFPETNVGLASREHPGIVQQAQRLNGDNTHLHVVVGQDRVKEFKELLNKYNGDQYHYKKIMVHSAGDRTPESDGTIGISGTKMREYVVNGNYNKFMAGAPKGSEKAKKDLYNDMRNSMSIPEGKKAIFVVGGPCSGKDIVIRELKSNFNLQEFEIGNLHKKSKSFDLRSEHIIVNGPAFDFETPREVKGFLESLDYQCMMIFVDVSNDESKRRNEARIIKGSRLLAEEKRYEKWDQSANNFKPFYELFEIFTSYHNTYNEPLTDVFKEVSVFLTDIDINEEINNLYEKEKLIVLKKKSSANGVKQGSDMVRTVQTNFGGGIYRAPGLSYGIGEKVSFTSFRKKLNG